jgi:hypothetical protein
MITTKHKAKKPEIKLPEKVKVVLKTYNPIFRRNVWQEVWVKRENIKWGAEFGKKPAVEVGNV